jgi:hypothetical protein
MSTGGTSEEKHQRQIPVQIDRVVSQQGQLDPIREASHTVPLCEPFMYSLSYIIT